MAERNIGPTELARRIADVVGGDVERLRVAIHCYVAGTREPSADRWAVIAAILEVDPEQLRPTHQTPRRLVLAPEQPPPDLAIAA